MPLRVLIIPDKFKGTLTAAAAAEAIARGWRRARPAGLAGPAAHERRRATASAKSPARCSRPGSSALRRWMRPIAPAWPGGGGSRARRTAIIESAAVIGLAMLPPRRFHPFQLDTLGLGAVVRAAASRGARRCLMGIGGSATNDGGFGLARALGWEFLDRRAKSIERWTGLGRLERIRAPRRRRWFGGLVVATDVQNRLLGRAGRDSGLRAAERAAPAGFRAGRALPGPVGARR